MDDWIGPEVALVSCWWDGESGEGARVGYSGVTKIALRADGHGQAGQYDRIHVFNENGRHLVFPAHHVSGWEMGALSKANGESVDAASNQGEGR